MRARVPAFAILLAVAALAASVRPAPAAESTLDRLLRTAGSAPARAALEVPAYDARFGELRSADRDTRARRVRRDAMRVAPALPVTTAALDAAAPSR